MRTRFQRKKARSALRRYWRRTRLARFSSRRRIVRNAMRRRAIRPEIKYIDLNLASAQLTAATQTTFNITPTVIETGAGNGARIGQEVQFRKVNLRFHITAGNQSPNVSEYTYNPEYYQRIVIWTPRIDYAQSLQYMNTINLYTVISYQAVTVHKDMMVRLSLASGQEFNTNGNQIQLGQTGLRHEYFFNKTFMFPRKARFAPTNISNNDLVDVDKDVLYMTLYNDAPNGSTYSVYSFGSRLTYIDS